MCSVRALTNNALEYIIRIQRVGTVKPHHWITSTLSETSLKIRQ